MKQTVVKYDEESMIQKLKQIYRDTTQPVYFLKLRLPYQKIENGQVVNVTFYKLISEINRAMEKTENLFLELFGNKGILTTQINLLGDIDYEEINLKSFVEECMQGLERIIEKIQAGGEEEAVTNAIHQVNRTIQLRIDETLLHSIICHVDLKKDNLLLIQNTDLSQYLNEIAGKEIPYIFYDKNDSSKALEEKLEEKKLNFQALKGGYSIIIPNLLQDQLLRILWDNGINVEKQIILARHPVVSLKNFFGNYEDFFHNHVECERQRVNFDLSGFGARAEVKAAAKEDPGMVAVNCSSQSSLYMGENAYTDVLSIGLLYSAAMRIHENTAFSHNNIIRIGPFCSGEVGMLCTFGENIWVLIGDEHSIFDIHTRERINYLADDVKKLRFKIGDHVYVGDFTTIIGGCEIGENCYVEIGTILNKSFPPGSYILGNPSFIGKKDICWKP